MADSNLKKRRRYFVQYSWDGESLSDGRNHTWDVVDRQTERSVHNTDSRAAARASCAEYNVEHERTLVQLAQVESEPAAQEASP